MSSQGASVPEFDSFGIALRYYREHIAERIRRYVPGRLPDIQLSAREVVSCMKEARYPISQAAYSDIEQGLYLPKEPERFLEAVVPCLALERDSAEYRNLMDHLVFDVLAQKVGAGAAAQYRADIRALRRAQAPAASSTSSA